MFLALSLCTMNYFSELLFQGALIVFVCFGLWLVWLVSRRCRWFLVGVTGLWLVLLVSGQCYWSLVGVAGLWFVLLVSG